MGLPGEIRNLLAVHGEVGKYRRVGDPEGHLDGNAVARQGCGSGAVPAVGDVRLCVEEDPVRAGGVGVTAG